MIELTEDIAVDSIYYRIRVRKATQSPVAFWYAVITLLCPDFNFVDIDNEIVDQWSLRALEGIKVIARGIVSELRYIEFDQGE